MTNEFLSIYERLCLFSIYIAKQKQPGAVKKGAAKQSTIKSIVWHLRWPVRTRADISLQPNGLVRSRTDNYQVAAKRIGKIKK